MFYVSVVKSCVRYRSSTSRVFNSYNGLKQGDPSSPLLFMLFINDISKTETGIEHNKDWHNMRLLLCTSLFSLFSQMELTASKKCKLFDVLVAYVLNYGAEVWGNHESKDIENLLTKSCRWILNVRKSMNLSGLYGELGRFPLLIFT